MTPERLAKLRAIAESQRSECDKINERGLRGGEHYPVTVPHGELIELLDAYDENVSRKGRHE